MNRRLNGELLSTLIKEKRNGLNLRAAAVQAGVGFSTLSRLERNSGAKPDLDTLERVASWLGVSVAVLFAQSQQVRAHLRARKRLSSATAGALRDLIERAREQFELHPKPGGAVVEDREEEDELAEQATAFGSPKRWEETAAGIRQTLDLADDEALDPFKVQLDRVKRVDAKKVKQVDPNAMAQLLGAGSSEWSAATIPLNDEQLDWVIVLNDSHNIERRRATLMEEYCHIILGHDMTAISAQEGVSFRDYRPELEAEAYYVGAAVLVPEQDLRKRIANQEQATVIAEHYGVSRELVEFRIKRLGLWYAYGIGLRRQS
jgi:transcriptional regulator with XRE-family HTH domain